MMLIDLQELNQLDYELEDYLDDIQEFDDNDDTRNVAGEPSTWDDAEYGSEDDGG